MVDWLNKLSCISAMNIILYIVIKNKLSRFTYTDTKSSASHSIMFKKKQRLE